MNRCSGPRVGPTPRRYPGQGTPGQRRTGHEPVARVPPPGVRPRYGVRPLDSDGGKAMADVRPFRALRPRDDLAGQVIAPPYDVLTEDEARALARNRHSFVRVTRSEV